MSPKGEQPKSVGIWIRVSTEDQARGESPEHHERRACAYAELKGWAVAETYRLEAVSGKAVMGHPEAQRMLADIRSGRITGLVFSKLARLARNTKELLDFADLFRASNADLISLQEAIDTSTPAGRLFFTMIAAMAQWEREEIADRVAATVPIRAKLGKSTGGAAPFGYRWVDKRLTPEPAEAPVRRLMFELFAEHQRKRTVARILNDRGYRTRRGDLWSATSIERLLTDTSARGVRRQNYTRTNDNKKAWTLKPESDWVMVPVEPIVSEELWDRCERILAEQRVQVKPVARRAIHLFAGFAYCACGTKMYVRAGSPKYVCEGCRNKIPIGDLEAVFRSELHRFLISSAEIEAHRHATSEAMQEKEALVAAKTAALRKVEQDDDRLYELYLADALSKEEFALKHRPLAEQRQQIEDELPRMEAELDVMRISAASEDEALLGARSLIDRWEAMTASAKRQMVEATTRRITIGKDEVEIDLVGLPSGIPDQIATHPHACVAFLTPGVSLVLRGLRPDVARDQGETLGAQLRRRRRELGLQMKGVAEMLGVDPKTLMWWERDERPPTVRAYPPIVSLLGYEPWPEPRTLADALLAERRRRGLSIERSAEVTGVDPGTWLCWERGVWKPSSLTLPAIDEFLGISARVRFAADVR